MASQKTSEMKKHSKHILTREDFDQEFVSIEELADLCEVEPSRIRQICRINDIGFVVGTMRLISRELIPRVQDACLRSRKKLLKSG